MNENIKTTTSKKRGGLLMKIQVFKLLFLKKTDLCLPLLQRFHKTFAQKSKN